MLDAMTGHHCCFPFAQRGDRVEPETAAFTSTAVRASTATMVRVEGGRFLMGSDDALSYPEDGEGPVREVTLSAFRIDACAVSNADFAAVVAETSYITEAERSGSSFVFGGLLPDDFPPPRASPVRRSGGSSNGPTGRIRRGRNPMSVTGRRIPSCTSRMPTRRPSARGRASGCRPRRSGSTPPAAA
jgi:formylglycine-generating enzyme required for sulfatase activity